MDQDNSLEEITIAGRDLIISPPWAGLAPQDLFRPIYGFLQIYEL